jgi:hypothetical protein
MCYAAAKEGCQVAKFMCRIQIKSGILYFFNSQPGEEKATAYKGLFELNRVSVVKIYRNHATVLKIKEKQTYHHFDKAFPP